MSRVEAVFARLRSQKKKALIAYLTVGFPRLALLSGLVEALGSAGVDILELGIPFSDPLADGPTIQAASSRALEEGVTPGKVLRSVETLRRRQVDLPIVFLSYYNPIFRYGLKAFLRDSASSGVDGLIVADLPPEEAQELLRAARFFKIDTIFLAAPTSPRERLRRVAEASTGFIYYVSLTGVTGARERLSRELCAKIRMIKGMTELPVCVGFGISRPSHVRETARVADGVIVGSALLDAMGRAKSPIKAAVEFLKPMRAACR